MPAPIIFDLFGTLVDIFSKEEYQQNVAQIAGALGAKLEDFVHYWSGETVLMRNTGGFKSIRENIAYIVRALDLHSTAEQIARGTEIRQAFFRNCLRPRPKALPVLDELRKRRHPIGLISDCGPDVPLYWPQTPLAARFDAAIFSCQAGLKKPAREIYMMACDRLHVRAQDCLFVGDGDSHELTGAVQAGMKAVQIRAEYEDEAAAFRTQPDDWRGPRISSLEEVLYLTRLC